MRPHGTAYATPMPCRRVRRQLVSWWMPWCTVRRRSCGSVNACPVCQCPCVCPWLSALCPVPAVPSPLPPSAVRCLTRVECRTRRRGNGRAQERRISCGGAHVCHFMSRVVVLSFSFSIHPGALSSRSIGTEEAQTNKARTGLWYRYRYRVPLHYAPRICDADLQERPSVLARTSLSIIYLVCPCAVSVKTCALHEHALRTQTQLLIAIVRRGQNIQTK